jgi:hypothetical protein
MPFPPEHFEMQDEINRRRMKSMHALRLNPDQPGMTHEEFVKALDTLGDDAARWRWLKRHWWQVLDVWAITPPDGDTLGR